eukprot:CAMPEP_0119149030 /NCGR_PEP_ID=MMETSP1310-20130426/42766_1 /TAXON_ID=464262 /ORGANISM="Genus nov. species nov., Strain RCC2339" /LENGTH=52 /DNA_ID=CAMNT_0007141107 /DNA_START=8 /DNA_END=162 /DNA_ORIENTATION=-
MAPEGPSGLAAVLILGAQMTTAHEGAMVMRRGERDDDGGEAPARSDARRQAP